MYATAASSCSACSALPSLRGDLRRRRSDHRGAGCSACSALPSLRVSKESGIGFSVASCSACSALPSLRVVVPAARDLDQGCSACSALPSLRDPVAGVLHVPQRLQRLLGAAFIEGWATNPTWVEYRLQRLLGAAFIEGWSPAISRSPMASAAAPARRCGPVSTCRHRPPASGFNHPPGGSTSASRNDPPATRRKQPLAPPLTQRTCRYAAQTSRDGTVEPPGGARGPTGRPALPDLRAVRIPCVSRRGRCQRGGRWRPTDGPPAPASGGRRRPRAGPPRSCRPAPPP